MDSIKQKWKNYSLQKRLKDLWEDYKKVSHLEEDPETLQKFKSFLEQANLTVKQFAKQNDKQLEELLGDANQILESILCYLGKFPEIQKRNTDQSQLVQDIMEQCVLLAEQILRDPKYKRNVENSHNVLSDFLNLIEKTQKNESKVILIKLLVLFSDNLNQRIEFFEQQGFNKLLQILLTRDPQLNRIISKALLHFLSIEDINQVDLKIENSEDLQEKTVKSKLSNIVVSLRHFAFKELQKVFLPNQIKQQEQEENTQLIQKVEVMSLEKAIEQQISAQMIFETDLNFHMNVQLQSRSTSDQDENTCQIIEKMISEGSSPLQQTEQLQQQQPEELIKEFKVLQGGFKAILETLLKASTEVQVDLLQTIKDILQTNSRNKFEFKRVNGYQFLSELICQKQDEEFEESFFNFIKQIVMVNDEIMDYEAFTLLMELLPIKQEKVLGIIIEILQINWKNVVIAKKLKLYYYLGIIQMRQYYNSEEMNILFSKIENEYLNINFKTILTKMHFKELNQQFPTNIYEQISQLEGWQNLEFEAIQSQLAVLLITDISKFTIIFNQLLKVINQKIHKKCSIMNSFDHLSEIVFKNITIIFQLIYSAYLQMRKQQSPHSQQVYVDFIQIVELVNQFLVCQHSIPQQSVDLVKNLVSQNRCQQFQMLIEPYINQINIQQILELFDFETKPDLAATHLQFRLNQALFVTLQKAPIIEAPMAYYLTYSQYEMWLILEKQPQNPINQMFDFLITSSKNNPSSANSIWMLLSKITLTDENAISIENLIQLFKSIQSEVLLNIIIHLSKQLPQFQTMVNLYSATIQFIESFLNKIDVEHWLDFIFSGDITKKLQEDQNGTVYSDLLSLMTVHSMFQGQLYEKFILSEYLTNALTTLSYESTKEQGIKLIFILYLLNSKYKNKNAQFTSKSKLFPLIQKLMLRHPPNNQVCNTVYKLVFWNFDSYHVLYTENSSNVSSVMTRSEFAEIIQKTQKQYLENRPPIQHIINLEMLELFFLLIQHLRSETYVLEILKIFESILDTQNITILLESNIVQWLSQLSGNRVIEQVQLIQRKLLQFDLQRTPKLCRIVDILRKQKNSGELILDYLRVLQQNPIIKNEANNFLKNFMNLIQQFDELVGFNEEVDILLFQTINLMASKNSPEVRSILKQLNYLDLRDSLALQVLRYKMEPEQLMDLLSGMPFSQICGSKQFKESHCMAYLLKRLIQYQNFGLQMLIIKILKYDVGQNEDNRKYVGKLILNENLLNFFYPLRKASKSLKCFEQEDSSKLQRSNSPDPELLGPNATVDGFLTQFFSDKYVDDRKQMELAIDKTLIPVENEIKKYQNKLVAKKQNRLLKLDDQSEELKIQTQINEWEIQIQQRLMKSSEKYKQRQIKYNEIQEQCLAEGENQWFKMCLNQ